MYRRIVISSPTSTSGSLSILYHASGAVLLYQNRVVHGSFDSSVGSIAMTGAVVFDDAIRMSTSASLSVNRSYEFVLDVQENQSMQEGVEEISSAGISIIVYNADGVIVCHNGIGISTESAPAQTNVPGIMTSEPIDGPGEML